MAKHIHKINKNKVVHDDNDLDSIGYTALAAQVKPDADNSYAKKTTFPSGRSYYYIKCLNARFYNPYGLYDAGKEYKSMGGNKVWVYRKVNEKTFLLYISFLKTKNTVWLSNAERENL